MANDLKTSTILLDETHEGFEASTVFYSLTSQKYDNKVTNYEGMPTGGTLQVRMPGYPKIEKGRVATVRDEKQEFETITVTDTERLHKAFSLTSEEMYQDRTAITDTTTYKIAHAMGSQWDLDFATDFNLNCPFYVGSTTTSTVDFSLLNLLGSRQNELGITQIGRSLALTSQDYLRLTNSISTANLFDTPLNKSINEDAFVGRYANTDIVQSNILGGIKHTRSGTGTEEPAGTLTVKAVSASADYKSGTISLTGTAALYLRKGDRLTIETVFYTNKTTKQVTSQKVTIVVQTEIQADGSGDYDDIAIKPGLVPPSGTPENDWFDNINALPAVSSNVTLEGEYNFNPAISMYGACAGSVPMPDLSTIGDPFGANGQLKKYVSSTDSNQGRINADFRLGFDSDILQDTATMRMDLQPYFHTFLNYNFAIITQV